MINKLIETIIKRKIIIFILLVAIVIGGAFCYNQLPRTSFPKVDIPMAVVTVIYPGASPEEVEKEITKKVEDKVMSVSGYDECSSQSLNNACAVSITFDKTLSQEELDMSIIELRRKMTELKDELPSTVPSINVSSDSMDCASLVMAVTGNDLISNDELSQRANDLSNQLKQISGVSQVKISGNNDSEVSVKVKSEELNRQNLSLYEITQLISANNAILPIGNMTVNDSAISVTTSGRYEDIDAIKNIIVGSSENGVLIHLSDIADVEIKEPDNSSFYLMNNQKSILVSLYFQEDLNVVSKGQETRTVIEDFKETLSDNITISEVYFQPDDVKNDINNFIVSLIEAIIVVMLVIMLGMNKRNGMVVSIAIPIIIFMTFIMMKLFEVQIHFISLASLIMVLGMLVDNSIVVSDSIQTYMNQGIERMDACKKGVSEVILSVFLSMITTVTVFASMFTLSGTYKQVASAIPYIAVISMVISFFVSILVTPVFCYLFLKPEGKNEKEKPHASKTYYKLIEKPVVKLKSFSVYKKICTLYNKVLQKLSFGNEKTNSPISVNIYRKLFNIAFNNKKKTILFVITAILLMAVTLPFVTVQLMPKTNKEYVLINITNQTQNDLLSTEKIVREIQDFVVEQPETEMCLSGVGICVPRYNFSVIDRGASAQNGDICLKVNLENGKRFKKTYQMVDFMQTELDKTISGANIVVDELGIVPATEPPVAIYIKGENMTDINTVSSQTADILSNINGIKGVSNDVHYSSYGYYVNIDDKKRNSLGLSNQEVQNELNIAINGRTASVFYQNGKQYDINVKADLESTDYLNNYKVKSSSGNKFMINQFADIDLNATSNVIKHVNGVRGAVVGGYVKTGYGANSLQTEFEKEISKLDLPEEIEIEYRGEKHMATEAITTIAIAGMISIIIIFLILYMQFGCFKQVLLLFSSIPIGAVAGMASLILTGQQVSFFAMLGMLSMLGIVLANAIVLVTFINDERKNGASVDEACKIAGEKRLRPILMSTMTTVFGFLPLAMSGQTLFVGMSVLLMVALTFCMVFNLVMVPLIYSMMEKDRKD